MHERLKSAFGSVHAPDEAKQKALYAVESRRKNTVRRRIAAGLQIASACVAAVLALVCFNIYGSETAYVSLDINPSMSLAINDFDRVIEATAYGPEAERLLQTVHVDGLPYAKAVEQVMGTSDMAPYLSPDRTVWIAVQAGNPAKEAEMEQAVQAAVEAALSEHHADMAIAGHAVTEEVRVTAEDAGVTATRYIAIVELQEVDPSASIDSYRHSSISEIQDETASHHAADNVPDGAEGEVTPMPADTDTPAAPTPDPAPVPTPAPAADQTPVADHDAAEGAHHRHGAGHH